ncbi:MAG: membrane protein insertase YidC [SAR86 cluster bacterium]|nr:membrane protein insertase YidC [SAR86 cluster bacterium]
MDKIKGFIILSIATVSYYLLIQWSSFEPVKSLVLEEGHEVVKDIDSVLIDSNDSLTKGLTPLNNAQPLASFDDVEPGLENYKLQNNVLSLEVDPKNGALVKAELLLMKNELKSESNIILFDASGESKYLAKSGFLSQEEGALDPIFSSFILSEGGENPVYVLSGENEKYIIKKTLSLKKNKYDVEVRDQITLKEGYLAESLASFSVIERSRSEVESGFMTYAYLGPVFSLDTDKYEKVSFDDVDEEGFSKESQGGWASIIQHYFISAWVPNQDQRYLFQARRKDNGVYSVGMAGESFFLEPGITKTSVQTLFVGPKIPKNLNEVQENLALTVDYGWLFWLGEPLYWVLNFGFSFLGNWGLAIIFLTVSLKLLLWPLSAAAYRSMGKMRALSPKLQELQATYGSDKQKFSQEMMALYQKEGVNPLGGCLPMVAQMPFFVAFYWVLIETVELRHAPFFFWIVDLSQKDPFFVLPLLNAAGMYYSQTLTPTPPNADPMQAQMMKYMPLAFSALFCFFPAGLVLYWLINMLVTLIQQLYYLRPYR